MHNNTNEKHSGMMWMMLICCLVPIVILLLAGGKLSSGGGYLWPILIGGMVLAHLAMLFRRWGVNSENTAEEKSDEKIEPNENKHNGCCH